MTQIKAMRDRHAAFSRHGTANARLISAGVSMHHWQGPALGQGVVTTVSSAANGWRREDLWLDR